VADDTVMATVVPPFLLLGLSVSGSIWVDPAVMRSGAASEAVPNLTAAAVRHNLSALFVDFEPGGQGDPLLAASLARFMAALAAALHAVGRSAEMAVDAVGILNQYALYATAGVDRLMTMATYNGWGADGAAGFVRLTSAVDAELQANVSRAQLAVAVGSMIVGERPDGTGTPCPDASGVNLNFQWTPTGLARFVAWLELIGVRHLDVYRCDLCLLNQFDDRAVVVERHSAVAQERPRRRVAPSSERHTCAHVGGAVGPPVCHSVQIHQYLLTRCVGK
jgi:hypothetical protein